MTTATGILLGEVSEHRWARKYWPRMAWGWAVPWWLLQRTQWMLWVWAIAGVMVSSLSRKTQLCWAQCSHKPTLYHRVHGICATKDIRLRNCAILFGIFSSKCSSSKIVDRKKKGSKDQLINHLYQWLLLLISSIESVFCTHILLICKQIRLENNNKRARLMTWTRTVHWKSPVLLIWVKAANLNAKIKNFQYRKKTP